MHQMHGGYWYVATWDSKCVVVRRTETPSQLMHATWMESLNLCRLRLALKSGFQQLRDNITRIVQRSCVQHTWNWLAGRLPVQSAEVASCRVPWVPIPAALSLRLQALEASHEWGQVDMYQRGELWVRVGLDGVPLWKPHVVATIVGPCGKMVNLGEHSPTRHFVCSMYRGYDSRETLRDVFNHIDLPTNIPTMNGAIVQVHGKP